MVDLQIHLEHRSAGQLGNWSAAHATTVVRKLDQGLPFRGLGDPLQILLRQCYACGAPLSLRKMVDLRTHLEHPTAGQKVGPIERSG